MRLKRIIIYPKDIQRITGKSERYSRYLLKKIKNDLQKEDHHLVTVQEFCEFAGVEVEEIEQFID
ncbi:MAG: hypothetical protein ACNS60_21220 [Candidatus Cyclobacteriaceae bacterium M2_1C_046]